jgi:UDP-3-O-[3-hydroxymyristoyl] N-acetylglucosamine deacetylase
MVHKMMSKANRVCPAAQQTLKRSITGSGIGLHTGHEVSLTLRPAGADAGIVFVRTDLPAGRGVILARWDRVSFTQLCTTITNGQGTSVATIEHLMAALHGCGIDNAIVEIDGPEVPIVDGSSAPWVRLIEQAGLICQAARRRVIRVHKRVEVRDGETIAVLSPADAMRYTVEIDFANPVIGLQKRSFDLKSNAFSRELAAARTFGFVQEVEALREQGLAQGGSLDNAIVIDGNTILNEGGLRFADEFVRHKILDSVGDLYLASAPIMGHFYGRNRHSAYPLLISGIKGLIGITE